MHYRILKHIPIGKVLKLPFMKMKDCILSSGRKVKHYSFFAFSYLFPTMFILFFIKCDVYLITKVMWNIFFLTPKSITSIFFLKFKYILGNLIIDGL